MKINDIFEYGNNYDSKDQLADELESMLNSMNIEDISKERGRGGLTIFFGERGNIEENKKVLNALTQKYGKFQKQDPHSVGWKIGNFWIRLTKTEKDTYSHLLVQ